jgi:hypothetical protein
MAAGLQISHVSQGPGGGTSVTASIPGSSTLVTLTAGSTQVTVVNYSSGTTLYVNMYGGTCTSSNFSLAPGASKTWDGDVYTSFSILGSIASGSYGVDAH